MPRIPTEKNPFALQNPGTHLEMPGMTKGEIGTEMKIPISTAAKRILATRLYPPNINKQKTGSYISKERNVGKY